MKKIDICVGTDRNRNIRVRLSLLFIDDETGAIVSEKFHSGALSPGDDPQILRDAWDAHLQNPNGGILGAPWPKIPDEEWNEVLAVVGVYHTPKRIEEKRADDLKRDEQRFLKSILSTVKKV